MVKDPDLDAIVYETNVQERFENQTGTGSQHFLFRQESSLSTLSRERIRAPIALPKIFNKGDFRLKVIKRYAPGN